MASLLHIYIKRELDKERKSTTNRCVLIAKRKPDISFHYRTYNDGGNEAQVDNDIIGDCLPVDIRDIQSRATIQK